MTHLERVDTGAVHVYGDLVTPSGRRHPITLPPQDWEALEAALAAYQSAEIYGTAIVWHTSDGEKILDPAEVSIVMRNPSSLAAVTAEVDAMRPVVEAARAAVKALKARIGEQFKEWADSPWITDETRALIAAVDALAPEVEQR